MKHSKEVDRRHLTPMMQQYFNLKDQVDDAVLMFRMGDFYELFGKDADLVAPKLGLAMASRSRGDSTQMPFCGVPHHSAKSYWIKLIKMGFKIAIADQVEDPKLGQLVKREITKIITPGSIDELEALDEDSPNYIMGVYEDPNTHLWSVIISDVSTGELRLANVNDAKDILSLVEKFEPKELLTRLFIRSEIKKILEPYLSQNTLLIESLPEAPLRDEAMQKQMITGLFGSDSLESQPCGKVLGGEALLCALVKYLESLKSNIGQFVSVRAIAEPNTMILDETAKRDLEIFETTRRRQVQGSLYAEINSTFSSMGARLLRTWLANPLVQNDLILQRQQAVQSFIDMGVSKMEEFRAVFKGMPDLERLSTRVLSRSSYPHELSQIKTVLHKVEYLLKEYSSLFDKNEESLLNKFLPILNEYKEPFELLSKALNDNVGNLGSGSEVFHLNYDDELARFVQIAQHGSDTVTSYETKLRNKTGISSIKIKSHKSFGLLIEVTKANLSKIPSNFIRKQTMINNERFVTTELIELNEKLANATENCAQREYDLYLDLLQKLAVYKIQLQNIAKALATIDVIHSFAWKAVKSNYCKPSTSSDGELNLVNSRHPVVEKFVGGHKFVANSLGLSNKEKIMLITGPNMAGKSTVMRQVALCAILHQIGSYIPAEKAILPVFDRVFTRVGASDDLSAGKSTFMVEMSEAAQILRHATQKSLVVLDEIGRGTSTQDGLAIASAILEELSVNLKPYCLFATHYHELVPLCTHFSNVVITQTEVSKGRNGIIFTHRLIGGSSGQSFGIEVAKLAGLPARVIDRAKQTLATEPMPNIMNNTVVNNKVDIAMQAELISDKSDYVYPPEKIRQLIEKIENIKINRTTPLQALNFVNDLRDSLEGKEQQSLF